MIFPATATVVQSDLGGFLSGQPEVQETTGNKEPDSPEYWVENLDGSKGVRAAAYLRVSTDRQAQHGHSLEAQETELRELARKLGVSRLFWFVDAGKSGMDFDRRKLNAILDLAEAGEIDRFLATDIDRVGRKSRKLMSFLSDLRDCGVILETPKGSIDVDQIVDYLTSAIHSWAAQHENERRTQASIAGKVQSFMKRHWNKQIPLGYRKREDGWVEKEPCWEPVIRDVFDSFLRHKNYRAVEKTVNQKYGLGKPLTRQQVSQILKNPIYIGSPRYSEKAVIEDPALAFIDQETFKKAQELADGIHRRHSRKKKDAMKELLRLCGPEVLDFVPDIAILCPNCKGVMVKNGTLVFGKWTAHNYLCQKCGKQRKIPTKRQMGKIQDWAQMNRFDKKESLNTKKVYRDLGK